MGDSPIPAPAGPRRYTDREKALGLAVVAACAGSVPRAAVLTGVPLRTLKAWYAARHTLDPAVIDLAGDYAAAMRDVAREHAIRAGGLKGRFLDHAERKLDRVEAAGAELDWDDIATMTRAIADTEDKAAKLAQLLGGEPTERTESRSLALSLVRLLTPPA